ncbi:MAG: hypothetical protein AAF387_09160 [Pseudomonadota bacterium]
MNKNYFWASVVATLITISGNATATTTVLIGDNTNGYSVSVGNVILDQAFDGLAFDGTPISARGYIDFINGTYTVGPDGPSFSRLGNSGTQVPSSFVNNGTVFRIQDATNGALFDAVMTFWNPPQGGNEGGLGTRPEPFNETGFVIEVTPLSQPAPAATKVPAVAGLFLALGAIPLTIFGINASRRN